MLDSQPNRPPLFVVLFFSIFGFAGLLILLALWSSDEVPLFFKLFGSLIAITFVLMGFGMPISFLTKKTTAASSVPDSGRRGYKCPNCAAGLDQVEVSPSGDVKCSYCSNGLTSIEAKSGSPIIPDLQICAQPHRVAMTSLRRSKSASRRNIPDTSPKLPSRKATLWASMGFFATP